MEGRMFSVAVVVGVLLGLTIVAASSMSFGLYGSFAAAVPAQYTSSSAQTTTTFSATTTGAGAAQAASAQTTTTFSATTTGADQVSREKTTNSSRSVASFNAVGSLFGGTNSPSRINNIQVQSAPLTGFVLLPVLVAVILGMILYRVSRVRDEEEEAGAP